MILSTEKDGAVIFTVRVIPRPSRSEIVGEHDDSVKVKLNAPPADGAANAELITLLAKKLGVPKRSVTIISGAASKVKQIRIEKLSSKQLSELLRENDASPDQELM